MFQVRTTFVLHKSFKICAVNRGFSAQIDSRIDRNYSKFAKSSNNTDIKIYHQPRLIDNKRYLSLQSINRPVESFLDTKTKIFKSPLPDIHGYTDFLLHEFIWQHVDKWWNKVAVECTATKKFYTYGQLRRLSGKFATSLRKNNIGPGDTVAAILPNIPEYAIVTLGVIEAGATLTLINPNYTVEEIKRSMKTSGAIAVVTVPGKFPTVSESIQRNSAIRLPVIVVHDGRISLPEGAISLRDLVADGVEEFEKTGMKTGRDPDDPVILPFSSGTTGLPKVVQLTHKNLVANTIQFHLESLKHSMTQDQATVPIIPPIFHIYGMGTILIGYLSQGSKLLCIPEFSRNAILNIFENYKVSSIMTPPPLIQMLAVEEQLKKHHTESLKFIMCGAAPLGEEIITKFRHRAGDHFNFFQGYGLTETSPAIAAGIYSKNTPMSSSGILVPNTQVRIVGYDEENSGQNLDCNEVGEIYIRGPQVMKGYLNNPKATEDTMEDDWLKTGDLGSFDNDGHLYIRGRLKELIKVQGFQVVPAELEDILQGHKDVADAAVIGVPHERYGEIPKAFIVPKLGRKIDEKDIKSFVADRVVKYKHLGHVVVIEKIPKNAAGKILRKELQKI